MIINTPYYSQFLDLSDQYWMPRACGITCLKMILDHQGKETPSLLEMCAAGVHDGGFGKSGWIHDYFVKVAKSYGLDAHREERMIVEQGIRKIKEYLLSGNPVIVSVIKRLLGQDKFHMVLLTGFEEKNGEVVGFYYNEPESTDREKGKNIFVPIELFLNDWRKMAIFISLK